MNSSTKSKLLTICHIHQDNLNQHETDKIEFRGYNIETQQNLFASVSEDKHDNRVFIDKNEIVFSPLTQKQKHCREKLNAFIDDIYLQAHSHVRNQQLTDIHGNYDVKQFSALLSGMKAILDMHTELGPDNVNKSICWIEMVFSIVGQEKFSENFSCLIPIYNNGDSMIPLLPWNPNDWEKKINNTGTFSDEIFITPNYKILQECDKRVLQIRQNMEERIIMRMGKSIIQPFMSNEKRPKSFGENDVVRSFNPMTYLSLDFGNYCCITQAHTALLQNRIPLYIAEIILMASINTDFDIISSDDLDFAYFRICYYMHRCELGNICYRDDLTCEDMRRFCSTLFEKISRTQSLFACGDCEDFAQKFMQLILTITDNLSIIKGNVRNNNNRSKIENDKIIAKIDAIFGPTSTIQATPFITRGVFVDDNKGAQNHTFTTILHNANNVASFSIIENVVPSLIQEVSEMDCASILNKYKQKTQHLKPEYQTKIQVISKEQAKHHYQHIFVVGEYYVFEFVDNEFSAGAMPYTQYNGGFMMLDTVYDCTVSKIKIKILENKNFLLLVTPTLFFDNTIYNIMTTYKCSNFDKSENVSNVPYMLKMYTHVIDIFFETFVYPFYMTSTKQPGNIDIYSNPNTQKKLILNTKNRQKDNAVDFFEILHPDIFTCSENDFWKTIILGNLECHLFPSHITNNSNYGPYNMNMLKIPNILRKCQSEIENRLEMVKKGLTQASTDAHNSHIHYSCLTKNNHAKSQEYSCACQCIVKNQFQNKCQLRDQSISPGTELLSIVHKIETEFCGIYKSDLVFECNEIKSIFEPLTIPYSINSNTLHRIFCLVCLMYEKIRYMGAQNINRLDIRKDIEVLISDYENLKHKNYA